MWVRGRERSWEIKRVRKEEKRKKKKKRKKREGEFGRGRSWEEEEGDLGFWEGIETRGGGGGREEKKGEGRANCDLHFKTQIAADTVQCTIHRWTVASTVLASDWLM